MLKKHTLFILVFLTFPLSCSKAPSPPPLKTLTEAQQYLLKISKEEDNLDVKLFPLDNTVWIYIPFEKPLFDIKVSPDGPKTSRQSTTTLNINFLDAQFKDKTFYVQYDISKLKKYDQDFGYSSTYTEDYQKANRNILTAIFRAYSEVEKLPDSDEFVEKVPGDIDHPDYTQNVSHKNLVHSYIKTQKVPDFFVIVIADITKGMETQMIVHFEDLRRGMMDASFQEEYSKRAVIENPIGLTKIIGDKEGRHLDLQEMTWEEFLSNQIVYRIKYKYQRSSFPPSEDSKNEILNIIKETLGAYLFQNFQSVAIHDLNADEHWTMEKAELAN